jgi:hypothetical protein
MVLSYSNQIIDSILKSFDSEYQQYLIRNSHNTLMFQCEIFNMFCSFEVDKNGLLQIETFTVTNEIATPDNILSQIDLYRRFYGDLMEFNGISQDIILIDDSDKWEKLNRRERNRRRKIYHEQSRANKVISKSISQMIEKWASSKENKS